jgi:hypothetical protein
MKYLLNFRRNSLRIRWRRDATIINADQRIGGVEREGFETLEGLLAKRRVVRNQLLADTEASRNPLLPRQFPAAGSRAGKSWGENPSGGADRQITPELFKRFLDGDQLNAVLL